MQFENWIFSNEGSI